MRTSFLYPLVLGFALVGCSPRCYIKKTEQVDFYPTYVYQDSGGRWVLPVSIWVHESRPEDSLQKGLARIVSVVSLFPGAAEQALSLQDQVTPFLLRGRPGASVPIRIQDKEVTLLASDDDGFVRQDVTLPEAPPAKKPDAWVRYSTKACHDDPRTFNGQALVILPSGTSIVADMDALGPLHQTDPALAVLFQKWGLEGAVLHYFSNSPWQMYASLTQALEKSGFPQGVLQLKTLEVHSAMKSLDDFIANLGKFLGPSTTTKRPELEALLQRFPKRQFILIGDAREQDEILYSTMARAYPAQVSRIYIRVAAGTVDASIKRAFLGLPSTMWKIFQDPADLMSDKI